MTDLSDALRKRALVAIFVSTVLELTGWFMLGPLVPLRLSERGVAPSLIGLLSASGWLGIFVVTPFAARIVQTLGRRLAFQVSVGVPVVTAAAFVFVDHLGVWFALYLASGVASGVRWILSEATIAELADDRVRGRLVGLFGTMIGATFIVGPALLALVGTTGHAPTLTMLACMVGGLAVTFAVPALPPPHDDARALGLAGIARATRAAPIVMLSGLVGGFYEVGFSGVLPLWGLSLGLTATQSALLVAASGVGSSLPMVPIGALADRVGRRPVQRACAALALIAAVASLAARAHPWIAPLLALCWGTAGGGLYTLAMIDIGFTLKGSGLIAATGVLVMSYTLGGLMAPLLGGFAIEHAPGAGLAALLIAPATLGLLTLLARPRTRAE